MTTYSEAEVRAAGENILETKVLEESVFSRVLAVFDAVDAVLGGEIFDELSGEDDLALVFETYKIELHALIEEMYAKMLRVFTDVGHVDTVIYGDESLMDDDVYGFYPSGVMFGHDVSADLDEDIVKLGKCVQRRAILRLSSIIKSCEERGVALDLRSTHFYDVVDTFMGEARLLMRRCLFGMMTSCVLIDEGFKKAFSSLDYAGLDSGHKKERILNFLKGHGYLSSNFSLEDVQNKDWVFGFNDYLEGMVSSLGASAEEDEKFDVYCRSLLCMCALYEEGFVCDEGDDEEVSGEDSEDIVVTGSGRGWRNGGGFSLSVVPSVPERD
ncbi:hypothetical protein HOE67_05295 [Candidatus Peregrinibacteria bacterium]|jgi:hypothetical protein|nr:hypothetical protein [Candidatus Peregrinibacteria bacterium]MBT4056498.1 hypothetical protein [Candidatus Peregrinibacteria bacterium]